MLGKNNFNERLRKMRLQAKQDRFSIRKLSIGVASVLLGFTFLGLNSQSVKADTAVPAKQVVSVNDKNAALPNRQSVPTQKNVKPVSSSSEQQSKKLSNGSQKGNNSTKSAVTTTSNNIDAKQATTTTKLAATSSVKPAQTTKLSLIQKPAAPKSASNAAISKPANTAIKKPKVQSDADLTQAKTAVKNIIRSGYGVVANTINGYAKDSTGQGDLIDVTPYKTVIKSARDNAIGNSGSIDKATDIATVTQIRNNVLDVYNRECAKIGLLSEFYNSLGYKDKEITSFREYVDTNLQRYNTAIDAASNAYTDDQFNNNNAPIEVSGSNISQAKASAEADAFTAYKTWVNSKIATDDRTISNLINNMPFPNDETANLASSFSDQINNLIESTNDLTSISDIDNVLTRYSLDSYKYKALAMTQVNKYAVSRKADYPTPVTDAVLDADDTINSEFGIENLRDSSGKPADGTNDDQVPDVSDGKSAIDNAITAYKDGLKKNIIVQIAGGTDDSGNSFHSLRSELADLQTSLNNLGIGDDPVIEKGLSDRNSDLAKAAAIAADESTANASDVNAATIDKATKEGDVNTSGTVLGEHKKAQDLLDKTMKYYEALKGLVDHANDKISQSSSAKDAIETATKEAAKNILNTTDTSANGPVDTAEQAGKDVIDTAAQRSTAIDTAYQAAKNKLGTAYSQTGTLDQAHATAIAALANLSAAGLKAAIKSIDQAAVADAASYANNQINNDNLPAKSDGIAYTNNEKQALKNQIATDLATGKDQIDKSQVNTDESINDSQSATADANASGARNNAIDKIIKDCSDSTTIDKILNNDPTVQRDRAKAQAESDLATIYQAAKDKLPAGTDPTQLTNAYNTNKTITGATPEEIKNNAVIAQQAIAKGAINAAAANVKDKIANLKHKDGTPYTEAEQNALKGQIASDVTAANNAIASAAKDKDGISKEEAEMASGDGSVSGTLNDWLATISNDGTGNSNAAQNAINNDLAVQKERAKQVVSNAAIAAKSKINHLANKPDGTPYTEHEKQALKNKVNQAIADIVNNTNGTTDKAGTIDKATDKAGVNSAEQSALDGINNVITDSNLANIINNDPTVAEDNAEKDLQTVHDAAVNKLKEQYGPNADTSAVDNAFNHHAPIDGDSLDDIASASQAAQQVIAHGAVADGVTNGKNKIKDLKHEDGTAYTDAEKNALNNLIDNDAVAANNAINQAEADPDGISVDNAQGSTDGSVVSGALNNGLNTIAGDSTGTSSSDTNAINNNLAVQKERAKQAVTNAATAANETVDSLKNKPDGTPYTNAEKQAIKDAIQNEVDKANGTKEDKGTIDNANSVPDVNTAKQNAINAINKIKDACTNNDNSVLDPIINSNAAVQKEHAAKQAAQAAVTAAADKARQDMGVTAGSPEAAKIDSAEQAALNTINQVTDGKYTAAENTGLAGVVEAEKQTVLGKVDLGDTQDRDTINNVSSSDTTADNVVQKQNAIKDAYDNAGRFEQEKQQANAAIAAAHQAAVEHLHDKFGSNADTSKTDAAFNNHQEAQGNTIDEIKHAALTAEKEIAKGEVTDAAANAKDKIDHLTNKPDGTPYTEAEKQALKDKVSQAIDNIVNNANGIAAKPGTIDNASDENGVATAANNALNDINSAISDSNLADILDNDPTVQKERAINKLRADHDQAVQELHNTFGNAADTAKVDAAYTTAKNAIDHLGDDSGLDSINAAETAGEKAISKGVVQDAQTAADKLINNIKHNDTQKPYTSGEQNALTHAVQDLVNAANGTEKNDYHGSLDTATDHDQVRKNVMQNILDTVTDNAAANQAALLSIHAASDAITKAANKARQDMGATAGSKEAAKIDEAEQAALNEINSVIDGNYTEPENAGLGKVIAAEKQTAKDKLEIVAPALDGITTNDTDQDNVSDKQDAIKNAYDAENKLTAIYQAAKEKLGADADTSALTRGYQTALNNLQGNSAAELNNAELAGERLIGKGAVQSAYDTAAQKINQMWPDDNSQTATDKKAVLLIVAQTLLEDANKTHNGTIDQAQHSTDVTDARNDAIDKIKSLHADQDTINNVVDNDKVVQIDKAHDAAIANGVDQDKVQQIRNDTANKIKTDLQNGKLEAAKQDELTGEKEIAKLTVQTAADKLKDQINHLSYSEATKKQLKDEVDKIVTTANSAPNTSNGTIDHATDKLGVDTARDNALHELAQITAKPTNPANKPKPVQPSAPTKPTDKPKPVQPSTPTKPTAISTSGQTSLPFEPSVATQDVTLMHNAYLYDENGKRCNKVDLKAGSVVTISGKQKIGDKDYFVVIDKGANNKKYYLVCNNVNSVGAKLTHNTYVYNKYGQRIKKLHTLKKGKTIATYGCAITIRGQKFYIIDKGQFVKAANVAKKAVTETDKVAVTTTAEKKIMHNAYLYDQDGKRCNGLIFNEGTVITTTGTKLINGTTYYTLDDGLYVKAANIDAKKLKLKHNAYVYSRYGNRKGKVVLKKHKLVKTYGAPVSIHGKRYYITAKGKFVKEANFIKK